MITEEAAARLDVDPSRVRQLIRAGRLLARKQGRDWWIEEADLARIQERKPGRPRRPGGGISLRTEVLRPERLKDIEYAK